MCCVATMVATVEGLQQEVRASSTDTGGTEKGRARGGVGGKFVVGGDCTCIKFLAGLEHEESRRSSCFTSHLEVAQLALVTPMGARDPEPPRAEQVASLRAELKGSQEYAQICEDEGVELRRQVPNPPVRQRWSYQRGL